MHTLLVADQQLLEVQQAPCTRRYGDRGIATFLLMALL
jgi:hypothetical protein